MAVDLFVNRRPSLVSIIQKFTLNILSHLLTIILQHFPALSKHTDRLSSGTYTSPDGSYRVTFPHLNAGVKVEEHYIGPEKHGVRFSNDSGTAYRILRIDNTVEKFTVEQMMGGSVSRHA